MKDTSSATGAVANTRFMEGKCLADCIQLRKKEQLPKKVAVQRKSQDKRKQAARNSTRANSRDLRAKTFQSKQRKPSHRAAGGIGKKHTHVRRPSTSLVAAAGSVSAASAIETDKNIAPSPPRMVQHSADRSSNPASTESSSTGASSSACCSVLVSHLAESTTKESLKELFSCVGPLVPSGVVIATFPWEKSTRSADVRFLHSADALEAVRVINGVSWDDMTLKVSLATEGATSLWSGPGCSRDGQSERSEPKSV